MKRNHRQSGVGMIEIMVVMIVIGIGIIAIAGLQTNLFSGAAEGKARAEAQTLARGKLEELRNYSTWGPIAVGSCPTDHEGQYHCDMQTGTFTDSSTGVNATFYRRWSLIDETTDTGTEFDPNTGVRLARVDVRWTDAGYDRSFTNLFDASINTSTDLNAPGGINSLTLDTFISYVSPVNTLFASLGPPSIAGGKPSSPSDGGLAGTATGTSTSTDTSTSSISTGTGTSTSDDVYTVKKMRDDEEITELVRGDQVILTSLGNRIDVIKGTVYSANFDWPTTSCTTTDTRTGCKVFVAATDPVVCDFPQNVRNCTGGSLGSSCASAADYTCYLYGDCTNGPIDDSVVSDVTLRVVPNTIGVNDMPWASPDQFYVSKGGSLSKSVLTNDLDPDGDALTVSQVAAPAHGTLTLGTGTAAGTFTYTPTSTYTGTDSFTYKITDTATATGTATSTVKLTVVQGISGLNERPRALQDTYYVLQGATATRNVLTNDYDIDGDTLAVSTSIGTVTHGTATMAADGAFTYVPESSFTGTDTFTYTLTTPGHGNGCKALAGSPPDDVGGQYNGGWYGKVGIYSKEGALGNNDRVCQGTTRPGQSEPAREYQTERWTTTGGVTTLTGLEGINGSYYCHNFLISTIQGQTTCLTEMEDLSVSLAPSDFTRSLSGTARNYAQSADTTMCEGFSAATQQVRVTFLDVDADAAFDPDEIAISMNDDRGYCTPLERISGKWQSVCSIYAASWTGTFSVVGEDRPNHKYCTGTLTPGTLNAGTAYSYTTLDCTNLSTMYSVTGQEVDSAGTALTEPSGRGTIDPSLRWPVAPSGSAAFAVTPEVGYAATVTSTCPSITPTSGVSAFTTTATVGSADCTVKAYFGPTATAYITASAGTGGTISPVGRSKVNVGATKDFVIKPNTGMAANVAGTCGGSPDAGESQFTYTTNPISGDCTVAVTFGPVSHDVTALPLEADRLTAFGYATPATQPILDGSTATIDLHPEPGYTVYSVTGCGTGTLSGMEYTTGPVTGDCQVTATFGDADHVVTATVTAGQESWGSVTPSTQTINHNEAAQVTVSASANYTIDSVTGCGGTLAGDVYTIEHVTADCEVTANFAPGMHKVTTASTGHGTISPTPEVDVPHNGSTSLTLTPEDSSYEPDAVTGCPGTLSGNSFTAGPIVADCTATASFRLKRYTVTTVASPTAGGTLSPTTVTADHGSTVTIGVSANTGYDIGSVGGCPGNLVGSTFTITNITGDCTLTANFTLRTYTVTGSPSANVVPVSPVGHGQTTTVTVTPPTNYVIDSVSGCGVSATGLPSGSVVTYTTGAITGACTVTATFSRPSYTVTVTDNTVLASMSPTGAQSILRGNTLSISVNVSNNKTTTVTDTCSSPTRTTVLGEGTHTYQTDAVTGSCTVTFN